MGEFYRFFALVYPRHWVAQRGEELLGVLTHQPTDGYADVLWLAAPSVCDEIAIRCLLRQARQTLSSRRPLTSNYPAWLAVSAFQSAGFKVQQTLLWMQYRL
jgi:hypothetical protein